LTVNWNESPILSQLRKGDSTDPFISKCEVLPIKENKTVLCEIPNKAQKVLVNASVLWNSTTTYQIGDLVYTETDGVKSSFECLVSCTNKLVTNTTYWQEVYFVEVINISNNVLTKYQYYVDYISKIITVNNYFNNSQLIFDYLGEGNTFISANSIYTLSEGTEVLQTLQNIIDTSAKSITFHTTPPTDEDGENNDIWFVYQE
jgi:Tfp pilus assembly protein PilZ